MAKKKKHPEHENLERWLVSYADFMTLLFATFTALYAMSQTDVSKLKEVSAAIREGFEEQSIMSGIKSILQGTNPPSRNPDPISSEKGAGPGIIGKFDSMTYRPGEVKGTQEIAKNLKSDLKSLNDEIETFNNAHSQADKAKAKDGTKASEPEKPADEPIRKIEASIQERGIRVSFDSRLLFPAGGASLQPDALKFLDKVAERLKKFSNNIIHVEGHTDNQPISTSTYPSNWELSSARASSIVRYFIDRHEYRPQALVAVGYGSSQPISNNATAEGRSKNRRVDIIIYSQKVSNLVNPRLQYIKEQALMTHSESSDGMPKNVIPVLPPISPDKPTSGLVRVIIRDKDGTEKVLVPKTKKLVPLEGENPLQHEDITKKAFPKTHPSHETH